MAHSGQSDYWGVCIDIKDRDNTGSSAVPVTQLSFIDWLKNLATKKGQINLDS